MLVCIFSSPAATTVYKNVLSITLPAAAGQMQVLPGHAEAFILLRAGDILLRRDAPAGKREKRIRIAEGVCHIGKETVTVVV